AGADSDARAVAVLLHERVSVPGNSVAQQAQDEIADHVHLPHFEAISAPAQRVKGNLSTDLHYSTPEYPAPSRNRPSPFADISTALVVKPSPTRYAPRHPCCACCAD